MLMLELTTHFAMSAFRAGVRVLFPCDLMFFNPISTVFQHIHWQSQPGLQYSSTITSSRGLCS